MNFNQSHRPGFSFIELLLFSGIIAIMVGAIVGFAVISGNISTRSEVVAEVEKTGELVLHRISRAIQEADIIVSPTAGAVLNSLLLVQTSPLKETFIHAHHGYVRMIETINGDSTIAYITNDNVNVREMLFSHTGSAGNEGVSFAFSVGNEAAGTEMQANQYVRSFRGTVSLHSNACTDDADCGGDVCCNGLCKTSCNTTCDSVVDCGTTAPTCNASCRFIVPACQSNVCALIDSGPCTDCNWCGDGDDDDAGEECDDGCLSPGFPVGCDDNGNNNNDACTRGCAIAECGDGIINTVEEECDDGNLTNGDGCDSVCMTEILCGDPTYAIDVVFVVDMSSSMGQGQQLRQIQAALKKFVEYMDFTRDKASVVAYGNTTTGLDALTNQPQDLEDAIDALAPSGKVNMEQGIYEAHQQLVGSTAQKKVIIVLAGNKPNRMNASSDACTMNVPPTPDDGCNVISRANAAKAETDLVLFSVGLSVGSSVEDLLKEIRSPQDTFSDYYFSAPLVRDLLDVYLEISDDICPCGDGIKEGAEQCDDGNDDNNDGCTNNCKTWSCGDGFVQVGYEQCEPPGVGDCNGSCLYDLNLTCGNGTVEGSELCDDGGTDPGDGCDASCQPEEYIPPFCHTDGELCFTDDDCGEPDPVTCAECVHGSCMPKSESAVPFGAVMAFDSATCPNGWESFDAGKGRTILGAGSGNTDADSTALTTRTRGETGGREYTTGLPALTVTATHSAPASDRYPAQPSGGNGIYNSSCDYSTSLSGNASDSNMSPFYVLTYCKKTAASDLDMTNAVSASTSASCPAAWSEKSELAGRFAVGAGSGNADADSAALTARSLGENGGREFTTGIPATNQDGDGDTPGANACYATAAGTELIYGNATPDTSLGGATTDSNMSPFIGLSMCSYAQASIMQIPAGMVTAFDLDTCPTGWSAYMAGAGRMIVGAGSGNTDADSNPLTARSLNDTGGREFTTGIPALSTLGTSDVPSPITTLAAAEGFEQIYRPQTPDTTLAKSKEDSNMPPFVVLKWCEKD